MSSGKSTARKANTTRSSSSGQLTLETARELTIKQPGALQGWKHFGARLMDAQRYEEALEALEQALALAPDDHESLALLGRASHRTGMVDKAQAYLLQALAIKADYASANHYLAYILYEHNQNTEAFRYAAAACEQNPDDPHFLITKCNIETRLYRYAEAVETIKAALSIQGDNYHSWNSLGNLNKEIGLLDEAIDAYRKAMEIAPDSTAPFSNLITTLHYHPDYSNEDIVAQCKAWNRHFSHISNKHRPRFPSPAPDKQLRIGMISDGFRGHPVGRMTTRVLEQLSHGPYELYFYSSNHAEDSITKRLKAIAGQWMSVQHLNDEGFAGQVLNDSIDILIDMAGHNTGNRMLGIAMAPAPVIVKWVGGQINTTGIDAIDYLLGDAIETPEGCDDDYVEKIIRLPDDYICYDPPAYAPEVGPLPARENGYVTFGCFNNAAKINATLLAQWAQILQAVPASRLLLKSMQYNSTELCERIQQTLKNHGISEDRLVLQGPSPHQALLETYNEVDIALDPWPYSGGVTTCEALLMGVPVITLPGPTFAGRHSASHLTNAGLPELVARDWDHYLSLATSLAGDPDTLATIRLGLREQLLSSPACDAQRFASHLSIALRAIWQRYCKNRPPVALTFDKDGSARFRDEHEPVEVVSDLTGNRPAGDDFTWNFTGRVVAIDNSAKLLSDRYRPLIEETHAFTVVAFDPRSQIRQADPYQNNDQIQLVPHALLGDGQPATLHACLDSTLSSTLTPLPPEKLLEAKRQSATVLTQLVINTVALDSIQGLENVDWLLLDSLSDIVTILEHGRRILEDTLVIEAGIAFQPTHQHQPSFDDVTQWANRNGFRFYQFMNTANHSHLPERKDLLRHQKTELVSADALFIPDADRLSKLPAERLSKLSFILHTVYGLKDLSYALLASISPDLGERYLVAEGFIGKQPDGNTSGDNRPAPGKLRKIFVVGFPKSGTSTLQKALQATGYRSAHWQTQSGEFVGKLMYQGLEEHDDPWHFLSEYDAITQADICLPENGLNHWPNLDFDIIRKIEERHPDCLFILNYREPASTVSSIKRWNTMQDRFTRSDIPGLPRGKGRDNELVDWIQQHMAAVRQFFDGKDNFIEIDIADHQAPLLLGQKLGVELAWWGIANRNTATQAATDLNTQCRTFTTHLQAGEKTVAGECLKGMLRHHDLGSIRQAFSGIGDNQSRDRDSTLLAGQVLRTALPTIGTPPEYPPFSTLDSPLVYVIGTSNARGFGSSPCFLSFFSSIGAEAYLLQDREYQDTLTRTRHIIERLEPGRPILLILGAEPRLLLENRFGMRPQAFGELMDSDYRYMETAARRYRELGRSLQASAQGPLNFLVPLPTLNNETNTLTRYMIDCLYQEFEGTRLGIIDPFDAFLDASTGLMDTRLQIIKNESELHFNHEGLEIIMSRLVDQDLLPREALSERLYYWSNMIPIRIGNQDVRIWNDPARSLKSEMTAATMMMDSFADYLHGYYLQTAPQDLVIFNGRQGFLPTRLGVGIAPRITCICLDDTDAEMCTRLTAFTGRRDITVSTDTPGDCPQQGDLVVCAYPDDKPDLLLSRIHDILTNMRPDQLFAFIPRALSGFDLQPAGYTMITNTDLRRRHIAPNWQDCRLMHLRRDQS